MVSLAKVLTTPTRSRNPRCPYIFRTEKPSCLHSSGSFEGDNYAYVHLFSFANLPIYNKYSLSEKLPYGQIEHVRHFQSVNHVFTLVCSRGIDIYVYVFSPKTLLMQQLSTTINIYKHHCFHITNTRWWKILHFLHSTKNVQLGNRITKDL